MPWRTRRTGAGVLGTESGEELVELADRGFDPPVGPVLVVEAETVARIAVLQTGGPTRPDPQSVDERPVVSRVRAHRWAHPLVAILVSTGARRRRRSGRTEGSRPPVPCRRAGPPRRGRRRSGAGNRRRRSRGAGRARDRARRTGWRSATKVVPAPSPATRHASTNTCFGTATAARPVSIRISSESGSALKSPQSTGGNVRRLRVVATNSHRARTWRTRTWLWSIRQLRWVTNTSSGPRGPSTSARSATRISSSPSGAGSAHVSLLAIGQRESTALPIRSSPYSKL